jgi:hypothetical protein
LQNDYLVLLLDGLDEVTTTLQPDCVAAINDFIDESEPSGLAVCCRLMEYQWLPHRLKLNGAICLESLSSEEVGKYLARGGSKLATLREAVSADPVLQELAQTPLMLSIMSLACQGAGGDKLARQEGASAEERRKQIFGLYVEQMFQRKRMTPLVFPKEKIIGWLAWLAGKMKEHSQSVFLVEGLQPSWLGTRGQRRAYGAVAALSLSLIFGLIFGLSGELFDGLVFGSVFLLGVGLGCWSESPLKNGVLSGSIGGLSVGLGVGLSSGPSEGLSEALGVGLTIGLTIGLIFGLIGGLGLARSIGALVEAMSWKWDQFWKSTIPGSFAGLRLCLIFGLIFGLIAMIIMLSEDAEKLSNALSIGLIFRLGVALIGGALIFGLIGGLIGGLVCGLVSGLVVDYR